MRMGFAEIPVPARVRKFFSDYYRFPLHPPRPTIEPAPAPPVAEASPINPAANELDDFQRTRLERVFSKINESDGPVIDPKDPLDQAVLYVRMAAREEK